MYEEHNRDRTTWQLSIAIMLKVEGNVHMVRFLMCIRLLMK